MKPYSLLSIGALALLVTAARSQESTRSESVPVRPAAVQAGETDFSDVSADELPAVRRAVDDESLHRDRLGRVHRLRELAAGSGDRARLAQLDDLERRELQLQEARRLRARAALSDGTWNRTQDFMTRSGVARARLANHQALREREAHHQATRERAAAASSHQTTRTAPPSRSSSAPRSSGGGSRGPR